MELGIHVRSVSHFEILQWLNVSYFNVSIVIARYLCHYKKPCVQFLLKFCNLDIWTKCLFLNDNFMFMANCISSHSMGLSLRKKQNGRSPCKLIWSVLWLIWDVIHTLCPLKLKLPVKIHIQWTTVSPLLLLAVLMYNQELLE